MKNEEREGHRRYRRSIIDHRGHRRVVPPIADAAHADTYHDPYCNPSDAVFCDDDGYAIVRDAFGVPIAVNVTTDPDANRDDGRDDNSANERRDRAALNALCTALDTHRDDGGSCHYPGGHRPA